MSLHSYVSFETASAYNSTILQTNIYEEGTIKYWKDRPTLEYASFGPPSN